MREALRHFLLENQMSHSSHASHTSHPQAESKARSNTVTYQKVVLGRRMGAEYEVLEGISNGAKVVTGGQIRLKDGIKVTVNE